MTLYPRVSQALWAYFRRQAIPRQAPVSLAGLGCVFFPAAPVSLGMKLDCSPIVYPAVAGSPESVLGQESVLLKGYLFFNRLGLEAELCTLLLEKGTLLPSAPSGGRQSASGKCWLCPVLLTWVTCVLEVA